MKTRFLPRTALAVLALTSITRTATAQDSAADDATRFRGGVQAELGPALFAGTADLAVATGLTGHVGVQIGETFGIYAAPQVQGFMGEKYGPHLGTGILLDVTLDDFVSVGLGPTIGVQLIEDGPGATDGSTAGLLGHLAFYPGDDPGTDGRRSGLTLGLDLHLRFVTEAYAACGGCEQSVGPPLLVAPALFIGHEAY